jgi:hypothetical protein
MEKLLELVASYRTETLAFFAIAATFATFRVGAFPSAWRQVISSTQLWRHSRLDDANKERIARSIRLAALIAMLFVLIYAVGLLAVFLHEVEVFQTEASRLAVNVGERTFFYLRSLQRELNTTLIIVIVLSIVELVLATANAENDEEPERPDLDPRNAHILAEAGGWKGNVKALWAERAEWLFADNIDARTKATWEDEWPSWYAVLCECKRRDGL